MIISLVRSEGVGFLKDPRRVNVATSRAQYAQFIFGNANALLQNELWKKLYCYISE
jgi:superfamily I DNA and/or RNA helicase